MLARNALSVNPHHTTARCPTPDILLIPGGYGTRREMHNEALIDWIRGTSATAELTLSVCTGALLLATMLFFPAGIVVSLARLWRR